MTEHPNVVLIHGAFADGSNWSAVVVAGSRSSARDQGADQGLRPARLADEAIRIRSWRLPRMTVTPANH
ncbi:MAG: hypothetical protein JWR58_6040 [Pseudonocardia sp.]|jgi:hypothetical protein|nr:hypothetical protein [Pseudonocardia sp.]